MDECRLCLKKSSEECDRVAFFHINNSNDSVFNAVRIIFDFDIVLNPLMIFTVCVPCKERIEDFYAYYQEVKVNLDTLQSLLNQAPVKTSGQQPLLTKPKFEVLEDVVIQPSHANISRRDSTAELEELIKEENSIDIPEEYEIVEYDADDYEEIEILEEAEEEVLLSASPSSPQPAQSKIEVDYEIVDIDFINSNPKDVEQLAERVDKLRTQTNLTLYEKRRIFYEFKCFKCGQEFTEEADLEDHQRQEHNLENTTYHCCLRERKVENANDHMRMHILGGRFTCYACGKEYSMIRRLRIHQNEQCTKSGTCPDCGEMLSAKELFKHFHKHSKENKGKVISPTQRPSLVLNRSYSLATKDLEKLQEQIATIRANPHLTLYEKRRIFYTFNCCKCQQVFNEEFELESHQKAAHQLSYVTYFCCNKERKQESANDHILFHIDPQQFMCYACGKRFSMVRRLRLHQNRDCKRSGTCPVCKQYLPAKTLFEHRLMHAKALKKAAKDSLAFEETPTRLVSKEKQPPIDLKKIFECDICNHQFRAYGSLKTHIIEIHLGSTVEKCGYCNFSTKYRSSMEQHVRSQHENPEKICCQVCGKYVRQLKIHHKMHHIKDNQPSECETCKKVFKNSARLKMHIKGTHSAKRFKCEKCGKAFRQKRVLAEHQHAHLGPSAGYLYQCDFCSYQVNYKRNLSSHIQKLHPEEWTENMTARLRELYGDDLMPKSLEGNQQTSLEKFFNQTGLKILKS